jgi:D-glycero-D-manno-heptose 1,7-bisphosphate phosphatase
VTATGRPAIFFDRDGVLNIDSGYVHRVDQFEWTPAALEAIRLCNLRGYFVFVVTNQSGIARGLYSEADVIALHHWMRERAVESGARIDALEYCPHHPDAEVARYRLACDCRKPAAGLIRRLMTNWTVDLHRSLLVGDRESDLAAARAAGIRGHLYPGGRLDDFIRPLLG